MFTTFETVQPPEIITPEIQQNYDEIKDIMPQEEIEDFIEEDASEELEYPMEYTTKPDVTNDIVATARSFVGSPYSWGGNLPSTGFDCSGLIQYIFKQNGIDLPRTAVQQGQVGTTVSKENAKPGDVIWFASKNSPSGQHVGLISKIENGQIYIIDAAGKKLGVIERKLPNMEIKRIQRMFQDDSLFDQVIYFFKEKGLTENQARGIYGNIMQESGGNYTATNRYSKAFGLAQWLGPRKTELHRLYGANPTLMDQLNFIWHEFNTTEKKALRELLKADTIEDATKSFATFYERPNKKELMLDKRIKYAYNK